MHILAINWDGDKPTYATLFNNSKDVKFYKFWIKGSNKKIIEILEANHAEKEESYGAETLRNVEKTFMLRALDHNWKEKLFSRQDYPQE